MDWLAAKDLILGFLGTGICSVLVWEVHELRTSVTNLNSNIAILLERTTSHENRLNKLEAKHDAK